MARIIDNTAETSMADKEYQELLLEALSQLSSQRRLIFTMCAPSI